MTQKIEFGSVATDALTGFTGMVYGYCRYMTGCDQYYLVPKVAADGEHRAGHWFDVDRLHVDPTGVMVALAEPE